jgi:hypothetical protein
MQEAVGSGEHKWELLVLNEQHLRREAERRETEALARLSRYKRKCRQQQAKFEEIDRQTQAVLANFQRDVETREAAAVQVGLAAQAQDSRWRSRLERERGRTQQLEDQVCGLQAHQAHEVAQVVWRVSLRGTDRGIQRSQKLELEEPKRETLVAALDNPNAANRLHQTRALPPQTTDTPPSPTKRVSKSRAALLNTTTNDEISRDEPVSILPPDAGGDASWMPILHAIDSAIRSSEQIVDRSHAEVEELIHTTLIPPWRAGVTPRSVSPAAARVGLTRAYSAALDHTIRCANTRRA